MQLELMKQDTDSQNCSVFVCRMTTSKTSTFDGIKLYYHKSKLQDSVQLQTVLALYDQETFCNDGQLSYLRLKSSVRLHIDQTMRTRNFRVRNEVVERSSDQESKMERRPALRGEEKSAFSGKHIDNIRKETHVVSVMTN